jgi:hypothetical protein
MPEDRDIQGLVAQALKHLGFPTQHFDIRASWMHASPMDLAISVTWPIKFVRSGTPTGVIQIGSPKRTWNPESKTLITFARLMDGTELRKEIEAWMATCGAMVRAECRRMGASWPREFPQQLKVRPADESRLRSMGYVLQEGEVITRGKVKAKRRRKVA